MNTIRSASADYRAHLGANTGGANGVYWVDVLGASGDGVRIRNAAARGKHRVETVENVIEPAPPDPFVLSPMAQASDGHSRHRDIDLAQARATERAAPCSCESGRLQSRSLPPTRSRQLVVSKL